MTTKENKKAYKKMINENGFFTHAVQKLELNSISKDKIEEIKSDKKYRKIVKTNFKLPDHGNYEIYVGTAQQEYEVGEVNGNGYKIDSDAWIYDSYISNPNIFFMHEDDKPIGNAMYLLQHEGGEDIIYFIDYNTKYAKENEYDLKNGYYKGLSTGHITIDFKFENKDTGERKDLNDVDRDEYDIYNLVITKAERRETSVVTLPSNAKALTLQNSLKHFFENNMKTKKNEATEEVVEEAEVVEAEVKTEIKTPEVEAENDAEAVEVEEETKEETKEAENDADEVETEEETKTETSENEVEENSDTATKVEKTVISEESKAELNKVIAKKESELSDLKKLNDSITIAKEETLDKNEVEKNELVKVVTNLTDLVINQSKRIKALEKIVDEIPSKTGRALTNQFAPTITEV